MDKSIVSLKHCVISLFFVLLAIDLVYKPALLMERPTSQSKGLDTMALVVASSLRCLSPESVETSYSVRKQNLRLFCNQTRSQIHTQQIQPTARTHTHTRCLFP